MDAWMDGWMDGWTDVWTGLMDGWMDGWLDGWMDGRDGFALSCRSVPPNPIDALPFSRGRGAVCFREYGGADRVGDVELFFQNLRLCPIF